MGTIVGTGVTVVSGKDAAELTTNVAAFFDANTLDATGGYTITPLIAGNNDAYSVLICSTAS